MKNEIIGKYITSGLLEESDSLSLDDKKIINDIDKITENLELLKAMGKIDGHAALLKVKSSIRKNRFIGWKSKLQKIAAILLLPLLSVVIWQSIQLADFKSEIVYTEISTPPTLRSNTTLPDGTKVWLNGNTTIRYPNHFTENERLVSLSGEAYFEVAKNKQKPFRVNLNNLLVEATGTEFNISSYNEDDIQEILLTEGSVNLLQNKGTERKLLTDLKVNELALFNKNERHLNVKKVDPEKYVAWRNGKILFLNDPLNDVVKKLERWYNVDFVYSPDTMHDYAFTGTFAGEDINQILKCIEISTPIHFKVQEPKVNHKNEYQKTRIEITDSN